MAQPTQLSDTATNHLKRNLCYSVKKKNFPWEHTEKLIFDES